MNYVIGTDAYLGWDLDTSFNKGLNCKKHIAASTKICKKVEDPIAQFH